MSDPVSPLTSCMAEVITPLGEVEERRAVEAAMARLDLRRPVVHGAELRIEKRRGGIPDRQVAVLVADLDGYAVHQAVIDADGQVVQVEERPDLVPPFTPEEIAEAIVLARADDRLSMVARGWGVRPAVFYPDVDGSGGGPRRRLVGVHFVDANDRVNVSPVASAVVDLTARLVDAVTQHEQHNNNNDDDDNGEDEGHGSVR